LVHIWLDPAGKKNASSVFFPFLAGRGLVQTELETPNEDTSILIFGLSRTLKLH
jgi:hypothetical protein